MAIKAHPSTDLTSADTIAECFDGVSDELCRRLWASLEVHPCLLDSFECDDYVYWRERNAIAHTWDFFTEEEQITINGLLQARDERQKQEFADCLLYTSPSPRDRG